MVSQSDMELFLRAVDAIGAPQATFTSLDELLESFGLSYGQALMDDRFVRTAAWNLSGPFSEDYKTFFLEVSPVRSVRYLVGALVDPARVEPVKSVLLAYGASRETVNPLVGALADPARVGVASQVLLTYGRAALQFIRAPRPGTPLYEPLTRIINEIKSGAPVRK